MRLKDPLEFLESYRIFAPWERATHRILSPLEEFIKSQTATALSLMFMTLVALLLANSPWREVYLHFFEQDLSIHLGSWRFGMSLHHWINEGLMTFFFFLIGLEIKREVTVGELSNFKAALLPVLSALGGMFLPAGIYVLFNWSAPTLKGWGVPMATDIAFALSALVLLGPRVPSSLLTFLIALAIVDDLGAVLVIALFYTSSLKWTALAAVFLIWVVLWGFNRAGIHHVLPYFLGGILMWAFLLGAGIHATVAGVLTAFVVPSKPKLVPARFDEIIRKFLQLPHGPNSHPDRLSPDQEVIIQAVRAATIYVQPLSLRIEHALHLPVALGVIPLFALANAGVHISPATFSGLGHQPLSLGIILGLLVGKPLGIAGMAYLGAYFKLVSLPRGAKPSQLLGVGILGGIGFTMSIFIAELAWPGRPLVLEQAKTAILSASFLAGFIGYMWLRLVSRAKS